MMYDILVIGAGPAGLTAAMYAARKELSVVVVSPDIGGQILLTGGIENMPGFSGIMSFDLVDRLEAQVRKYPVVFETAEVKSLFKTETGFCAHLDDGQEIEAKVAIVTAGRRPRTLGIPGETKLTGHGVSYCATCDGPLYRGKNVAVVGAGDSAVQAAIELSEIASRVILVVRSKISADVILKKRLAAKENVEILLGFSPVAALGDGRLSGLSIKNKDTGEVRDISLDGCFIEAGGVANSGFLPEELSLNEKGEIVTSREGETNVPGLFAAGDVTDTPYKQIVIAAGEGAAAALSAANYLLRRV